MLETDEIILSDTINPALHDDAMLPYSWFIFQSILKEIQTLFMVFNIEK